MGFSAEESAEFDAEVTIDGIAGALEALGHRVDRVGHARSLCARLVAGHRWDLVYNIAEGYRWRSREAQVPALLELYDVPYTCSDPLVCAVTLDKAVTKRVVLSAGLPTPGFKLVSAVADLNAMDLRFPVFAKPNAEGTGKGIDDSSRLETKPQLAAACERLLTRYRQPVLVEEYLPGREFTTAILGTGAKARVLGSMEVELLKRDRELIYSFDNKERCDEFIRYSALREPALRAEVEDLALQAYRVLECRDVGRVDIRLDADGRPNFIEVNPLPGMNPAHSDLPMIAAREGMSFRDLIGAIVASACERVGST
jgi:D-alanine-D-alanine ligase